MEIKSSRSTLDSFITKHDSYICPVTSCGRKFTPGESGVWMKELNKYICDKCANVQRDSDGVVWEEGENLQVYDYKDGFIDIVYRPSPDKLHKTW